MKRAVFFWSFAVGIHRFANSPSSMHVVVFDNNSSVVKKVWDSGDEGA